jgi:hypothetical protein
MLQLDVHSLDGLKNGKTGLVRVHGWQGTRVRDGARVFEAAKTGFGSSGPVGRNFLFPEFSFKRSVGSGPEFPVPRVFF